MSKVEVRPSQPVTENSNGGRWGAMLATEPPVEATERSKRPASSTPSAVDGVRNQLSQVSIVPPNDNATSPDHSSVVSQAPNSLWFREPLELPHVRPAIQVYPHSSSGIAKAFQERFCEVINLFKQNTEQHSDLRPHSRDIAYALKICGPTITESHPSILVFCRQDIFKKLEKLLGSKLLKSQYCRRKSSSRYSKWRGKQVQSGPDEDEQKPLFDLYFWRGCRPRTLLAMKTSYVVLELGSTHATSTPPTSLPPWLTMCGSVVTTATGSCIMGCVIGVGKDFYGLTASHAVMDDSDTGEAPLAVGEIVEAHANEASDAGDDSEDDDFVVDGVEYDDFSENGDDNIDGENEESNKTEEPASKTHTVAIAPTTPDWLGNDSDWALIRLDDPLQRRPNAFIDLEQSPNPIFLTGVALKPATEETEILVITGQGTVRRGHLQPGISYLGGIRTTVLSHFWTIILHQGEELKKGESGSLVIDAQSHKVYGHVVASNPIGEVYVSSLATTIEQIEWAFPKLPVSLPDPASMLKNLLPFLDPTEASNISTYLDRLIPGTSARNQLYSQKQHHRSSSSNIPQTTDASTLGEQPTEATPEQTTQPAAENAPLVTSAGTGSRYGLGVAGSGRRLGNTTMNPVRQNEYFVPRDGIDREVITADITRYLGNDALVRPGTFSDRTGRSIPGYFITAYRGLTTSMIDDLRADSARWEQERRRYRSGQERYQDSNVRGTANPWQARPTYGYTGNTFEASMSPLVSSYEQRSQSGISYPGLDPGAWAESIVRQQPPRTGIRYMAEYDEAPGGVSISSGTVGPSPGQNWSRTFA